MRGWVTYLLAGACALGIARVSSSASSLAQVTRAPDSSQAAPNQQEQDLLSGVDFVASKADLERVFTDPRIELNDIATDTSLDSGVRIRAIWALGNFPGGPTEATLTGLINGLEPLTEGTGLVMLRAAIYSIAAVNPGNAVNVIGPLLGHPSRDVRADAAHGLGKAGQPSAIPMLRDRTSDPEETEQVKWASNNAIRILTDLQGQ